jgi:hypothetical protein
MALRSLVQRESSIATLVLLLFVWQQVASNRIYFIADVGEEGQLWRTEVSF